MITDAPARAARLRAFARELLGAVAIGALLGLALRFVVALLVAA